MPDELADLFPNLRNILSHVAEGSGTNIPPDSDALRNDPEHSGVSTEQVDEYMQGLLSSTPFRFESGTSAPPPPPTHVEGDAGGGAPVSPSQTTETPTSSTGQAATPLDPTEAEAQTAPGDTGEQGGSDTPIGSQETETDPETETEVPAPLSIDLGDGRTITREEINAFARFRDDVTSDPALAQFITQYYARQAGGDPNATTAPPAGATGAQAGHVEAGPPATSGTAELTPPEDLDLDDPAIAALWNVTKSLHNQVRQLADQTNSVAQFTAATQQSNMASLVETGVKSFQAKMKLNDEQLSEIRRVAGQMNVLDSLMSGVDPITGVPTRPDPVAAIERAMDIAYWSIPKYRESHLGDMTAQQAKDATRQKKLAAVSGNSGSVPRTQPAPRPGSPESRQAMLAEVGQMVRGNWSEPE